MNRNQYLEICQKVSVLDEGVFGIKKQVPDDLKVIYNDDIFYPLAYMISFDILGKPKHHCVLHALETNSTTIALLSSVSLYIDKL